VARHEFRQHAAGPRGRRRQDFHDGASTDLREALRHGVAFHNADLDRDERLVIEEQFRAPGTPLRVIAATTTLAMGVNTPAEAVVIAGLEHPGSQPYSVAEYKNIVGRAGRLGFTAHGTSYLLALDSREEHYAWNRYVMGVPEDLHSRFIANDTDPRTLILRVLAAGRKANVKGVPREDIIDFLEGSFGAFQQKQTASSWTWDRPQIADALANLAAHKLVEAANDGCYHLTPLGRFAGEAGVEVESIVRLVEVLTPLAAASITDPALIAATQVTFELDQLLFPVNAKGYLKELQTWSHALAGQNIPPHVLNCLQRFVTEPKAPALRAKKAAACMLWISDRPISEIERTLAKHGGSFDGAAGPIRTVSSRTCDLLTTVARVATILHPDLDLGDRLSRLLIRLEVGVPAVAVEIAQFARLKLSRGDYQQLIKARLSTAAAVEAASDDALLVCLAGNAERAEIVRDAARNFREQDANPISPLLPEYEP
jgi:helicase